MSTLGARSPGHGCVSTDWVTTRLGAELTRYSGTILLPGVHVTSGTQRSGSGDKRNNSYRFQHFLNILEFTSTCLPFQVTCFSCFLCDFFLIHVFLRWTCPYFSPAARVRLLSSSPFFFFFFAFLSTLQVTIHPGRRQSR